MICLNLAKVCKLCYISLEPVSLERERERGREGEGVQASTNDAAVSRVNNE